MVRLSQTSLGLLLFMIVALVLNAEALMRTQTVKRRKREWLIPPVQLLENTDYTKREFIAKIWSDKSQEAKVEYFLSGPGADKPPLNLFVINRDTGFVRITGILDREKYSSFNLAGRAKFINGTTAEDDIPLNVIVLDQNDNAPYFELCAGNITEASKEGTFVMQVIGRDNDQAGTINSQISYSIVSQEPEGTGPMFSIDEKTGKMYVKEATLDRETHDIYKLTIKGIDFGGAVGGLAGTGIVEIKVLDINDNIPTLEKSEYTGSVDENVADVVVMRLKALDKDLEHTENWLTLFTIAKGNEDNLFSIETDKETNEGILRLIKPLDFEEIQDLELALLIENVAPLVEGGAALMDVNVQFGEGNALTSGAAGRAGASVGAGVNLGVDLQEDIGVTLGVDVEAGGDVGLYVKPDVGPGVGLGLNPGQGTKQNSPSLAKSYPINIAVNNVPEGPAFIPHMKAVSVSEDPDEVPEDGVITEFTAVDPDTGKPAEDIGYAKAYDPDNWFTIDKETAAIKLNKAPDRESPFLVNGTYIAKILAITKDMLSQTATGTIAIQVTDFNDHCPSLITTQRTVCSDQKTVVISASDEDVHPNGAPFTFRVIPEKTRGSWVVEVINESSATLHSQETLWPGSYAVQLEVSDAQGLACASNEVFTVDVCTCVEKEGCSLKATRQGTTSYELSTTAIGLMLTALFVLLLSSLCLLFCQCGGTATIFPDQFHDLPIDTKDHLISYHTEGRGEDKEVPLQSVPIMISTQKKVEVAPALNINSVPSNITKTYQTSACDYYSQKSVCTVPVRDSLLEYDFEGEASSARSVGCCSLLESDNDLQFLDDLGTNFKTLAEICSASTPKSSLTDRSVGSRLPMVSQSVDLNTLLLE
ncbi:desmoglein-4-like [Echeneis naucrates]|uniref:desmoglein-4-like n=1 Tax=Echeneis naucrates TaxID=173247 RepID=UPI0011137F5B|nr:desmoglein-4-like [Echeneis naucrates]